MSLGFAGMDDGEEMTMRLHLEIVDGGGKRIAEISRQEVFRNRLSAAEWRQDDGGFQVMLQTQFVNAARCLVAAHVHNREQSLERLDRVPAMAGPDADPELQDLLDAVVGQG